MAEYDLNDPTDVDIMRAQFNMITPEEFDEYIALAEQEKIGYKNVKILKSSIRKAGMAKFLSPKVIKWVLSIIEQLEYEEEYEEEDEDDTVDE